MLASHLNRTTGHWYSMKLCENTLTVRSERSRASGEVEEQAGRESGSLRLHSTMLKPNGQDATASEEVYESCVVRFSQRREISLDAPLSDGRSWADVLAAPDPPDVEDGPLRTVASTESGRVRRGRR